MKVFLFKYVLLIFLGSQVFNVKSQTLPEQAYHSKYRIQLGAFVKSNKAIAFREAKKAHENLGINTYVVFHNKLYKIHLGDFFTKKNASAALPAVKKKYRDAWVTLANNKNIIKSYILTEKSVSKKKIQPKQEFQDGKLPNNWKHSYYAIAKSAKTTNYLSAVEKEVYYYLNLARMNPTLFAKTFLMDRVGALRTSYQKSLYKDLLDTKPLPVLKPDKSLWKSAKCHAEQSGKTGYVGHTRHGGCTSTYSGECCSYGINSGLGMVLQLLIDEGIESLGHRKICLRDYTTLGVAIRKHKGYGTNAVLDFGY